MLTPWKESYDQPRQHIKKQRHYFANKGPSSQGYGFSSSHVWMWELDYKESSTPKNWCFWTVVLEKTLESQTWLSSWTDTERESWTNFNFYFQRRQTHREERIKTCQPSWAQQISPCKTNYYGACHFLVDCSVLTLSLVCVFPLLQRVADQNLSRRDNSWFSFKQEKIVMAPELSHICSLAQLWGWEGVGGLGEN